MHIRLNYMQIKYEFYLLSRMLGLIFVKLVFRKLKDMRQAVHCVRSSKIRSRTNRTHNSN